MSKLENVLKKPLISEKASMMSEKNNRYGFYVALSANKNQIKAAVEKLYDVKVLNVKTSILPGKINKYGRFSKRTEKRKKAFVQLTDGQKIEFFKGL